ncbi:MAG TPA: hypothetical protein VL326_27010 [Kofleriaceae bacterium]|nr:hypothetical protein [Kofleriaceae bacterium]
MSRRSRRRQPPPDLTSLFDVLFIVIFAALIRAAAVQQAVAGAPAPHSPQPPSPPVKLEVAQLHARAVTSVNDNIAARPTVIVRISAAGSVTAIETASVTVMNGPATTGPATTGPATTGPATTGLTPGKTEVLDSPLLEHSPDPDIALAYLGDRAAELRICRIVAVPLALPDLADHLVILAPEKLLADLPHALVEGLRRDVERCLHDQQGLAVIVDPSALPPEAASGSAGK